MNKRFERLIAEHADVLTRASRDLAMNFDVPAGDIIGLACAEMGIGRNQWDALQSYRIAKEQQ